MGSSGRRTHPVMPARPSDAPITFRNPRRETVSSHSEAPLGNSRCRASWKSSLPASSSSERQYSGPVFLAASCAVAKSIFSRTAVRSSFFEGQTSSRFLIWTRPSIFFSSFVIALRSTFLSPLSGLVAFSFPTHGLRPFDFAQGRLWAAIFRRSAAGLVFLTSGLKPIPNPTFDTRQSRSLPQNLSMARAAGRNVFHVAHVVFLQQRGA